MAFQAKFEDKDHGWAKWSKGLRFLGGKQSRMEVGLLEGITDPETIFKGAINEIGDGARLPERPWFRTSMDAEADNYLRILGDEYVKELEKGMPGGDARIKAHLGAIIAENLSDSISQGDWERNAKRTIDKKGFDWPLMETGDLSRAPTYRIIPPGK